MCVWSGDSESSAAGAQDRGALHGPLQGGRDGAPARQTHRHTHSHAHHPLCDKQKPQNVYVMRDVACAGYIAGCNTEFFDKNGELDKAGAEISRRLSFEDGTGGVYKSMLAFPMFEAQMDGTNIDTVMSITSRLLPWDTQTANPVHVSFPGGEEMYKKYNQSLALQQVHFGEDMKAAENMVRAPSLLSSLLALPPCAPTHRCHSFSRWQEFISQA